MIWIKKICFLWAFSTFVFTNAQNPFSFRYTDENGLPSNEVYSIAQDNKAFIWIGTDAGLYKSDGVRYIPYKSKTQKSKSITGVTFSTSGKLYCHNFQSQIFFVENDSLIELKHNFSNIRNISTTNNNQLIVNHNNGISFYNETSKTWKNYNKNGDQIIGYTNSVKFENGKTHFIYKNGIGTIENEKLTKYNVDFFDKYSSGAFFLEPYNNANYLFSVNRNLIYTINKNGTITAVSDKNLQQSLYNRKITNVRHLKDGNLWICTFNGVILYNPNKKILKVLYPDLSFSDCIIDREGNYWFTTLQSGIIRVPNLDYLVWDDYKNNKLTKITTDNQNIYFSTINGSIGKLNIINNQLQIIPTGNSEDIQNLFYNEDDSNLYFFSNNHLNKFDSKSNKISTVLTEIPPVKNIIKVKNHHLLCSSFGAYIYDIKTKNKIQKITEKWSRDSFFDEQANQIGIASNEGLLKFSFENNKWILKKTFLENNQIISIDFDKQNNQLLVLTFNGKIYTVKNNDEITPVFNLSDEIQTHKIKQYNQKIYVASNKGLWIYNTNSKKIDLLNYLSGLSSENIQDFIIQDNNLWLATGKGLQKIPLHNKQKENHKKAIVYLEKVIVKNQKLDHHQPINLDYGEELLLFPKASSYNSNGVFQYAYRIKNINSEWIFLPSSIENIRIQNLPSGDFEIELKVIDHLKKDSENTIIINGNVNAPFWLQWWFIGLCLLCFFVLVYLVFRFQWKKRQKKLQLQNELNTIKLTAIKSQMNPHFIFNSLNSIQDLVLKGDVENSYNYLNTFSNLVRKTLNYSDKDFIDFEDEIQLLEIYLSLEKLRFKKDFEYKISYKNTDGIQLPPMLIQPFIENSLVHGLLHKEGKKIFSIDFEMKDNLTCTITDNGIGRKQSKIIRNRQGISHQSFSGKAIEKRFDILSSLFRGDFGYQYEDLEEGTKVILKIPVKRKF